MAKDIKTAPTVREPGDLFQLDVKRQIQTLNSCPLFQGALITADFTAGVTKNVSHTLGRPYRGWFIVDRTVDAAVVRDSTINTRKQDYIPLQSDVDATLTLWIF